MIPKLTHIADFKPTLSYINSMAPFEITYIIKASLTFKCMTEHLFADFSYSVALDTYL